MPISESIGTVPSFSSVEELQEGLAAKGRFASQTLYPRDGTEQLTETEARISAFARVDPDAVLLYGCGMAAVTSAIEVALQQSHDNALVVATPPQLYSQSTQYLRGVIAGRGVKLVYFRPDSEDSIERVIDIQKPSVIIAETVGNEPNVSVLKTDTLLSKAAEACNKPVVILDNTLPLSTANLLGERLQSDDRVLVVESCTKAYTFNEEMSGIIYSKNPELICAARALRRTQGAMPGIGSIEKIRSLLPHSIEAFDERNRRIFKHTGRIAMWLQRAEDDGAEFTVSHPSLSNHVAYDTSCEFPEGFSPVLFLKCTPDTDQFELTEKLWQNPIVRKHADLRQSFGFDRSCILPDQLMPVVRVAGGAYTNANEFGSALYDAALPK